MAKHNQPPRDNRGDDERVGRSPNGSANPLVKSQGLPPSAAATGAAMGAQAPAFADDQPTPNEQAYGEPLVPMPLEGESAGVLGSGASNPYQERATGDAQYARYDGDPERELLDREAEEREYSDAERLEMFRMQMFQSRLPQLPEIPGYHICWLTTSFAQHDSIHARLRLGYTLLRAEDFPGWEQMAMSGGEFAGVISINEMVAAKLPNKLYQMYMKEAHHDAPGREENKLKAHIQSLVAQSAAQHAQISLDPSLAALGNTPRQPRFS